MNLNDLLFEIDEHTKTFQAMWTSKMFWELCVLHHLFEEHIMIFYLNLN